MQTIVLVTIVVAAFSIFLHSVKRKKEIDGLGRATLRFYGPAAAIFFSALFFLYTAGSRYATAPRSVRVADVSLELFIASLGFLVAIWFFAMKVTITQNAIEQTWWPLPSMRYLLAQLERIERQQFVVAYFSNGRKFGILPFTSGQQYFLERLEAQLTSNDVTESKS